MASSTREAAPTSSPVPMVIAMSLLALVSVLLLVRRRKRAAGLPPGPRGLPLLGSLPFLGADLHRTLTELALVHGPVMSLRLGTKLCVVLSSPAVVREALRDQDAIFANHDPPAVAVICTEGCRNMLWAPLGPVWRMLRKTTVRELLTPAGIEAMYPLRRREVRRMVAELVLHARAGEGLRVREAVHEATLNVMTNMLWGSGVSEGLGREFTEVMEEMLELLGAPNISDFFPAVTALDVQGLGRRMRRLSARYTAIFDAIVEQRMKVRGDEGRSRDFLDVMLDILERGDPQAPLTMAHVRALFLDLVVAGTDSTSITIEWAISELLNKPEILKKVYEELDTIVGMERMVEESDIPKLRYLDAVIRETLRLHPVSPLLIPHCPSSTCTVGGYTIPKDTKVFINVWAIQRDPSIWDDPLEFKPERILSADGEKYDFNGNGFNFLPFGAGRRVCVGIPLAEKMLFLSLAWLLHSFYWSVPEGEKLCFSEKYGIDLRKTEPLVAIPSMRLGDAKHYI